MTLESETMLVVRKAQNGDREAQNLLFQRFAPFVRAIVELRLGRTPARREDVDDLVQDALVRAYEGLDNFGTTPDGSFRAWLACCARCAVFDEYKRVRARKRGGGKAVRTFTELGSGFLASSVLVGKEATPSQVVMGAEAETAVLKALRQLKERYCTVIVYRKLCHMSYREIAEIMDVRDETNARVMCHRALERLNQLMAG